MAKKQPAQPAAGATTVVAQPAGAVKQPTKQKAKKQKLSLGQRFMNHPYRFGFWGFLGLGALALASWGGCASYRYLTRPASDSRYAPDKTQIERYEDSIEGKLIFDDKLNNLEVKIFDLDRNGLYRIETRKTNIVNTKRDIWSYFYDSKKGEVNKAKKETRKMMFSSRTLSYDRSDDDPFTKAVFRDLDNNANLIFNKAKIKASSELEQLNSIQETEELPQPRNSYSRIDSFQWPEPNSKLREIWERPRDMRRPFNINTRYY